MPLNLSFSSIRAISRTELNYSNCHPLLHNNRARNNTYYFFYSCEQTITGASRYRITKHSPIKGCNFLILRAILWSKPYFLLSLLPFFNLFFLLLMLLYFKFKRFPLVKFFIKFYLFIILLLIWSSFYNQQLKKLW